MKLFGTGSQGKIASYHWNGPFAVDATTKAVDTATHDRRRRDHAPASADTDTASLTAPATAGDYGYQLTVTDDGGATSSDTTVLTVGAGGGAPGGHVDLLTPGKARFQASAQRLVVDGVAAVDVGPQDRPLVLADDPAGHAARRDRERRPGRRQLGLRHRPRRHADHPGLQLRELHLRAR